MEGGKGCCCCWGEERVVGWTGGGSSAFEGRSGALSGNSRTLRGARGVGSWRAPAEKSAHLLFRPPPPPARPHEGTLGETRASCPPSLSQRSTLQVTAKGTAVPSATHRCTGAPAYHASHARTSAPAAGRSSSLAVVGKLVAAIGRSAPSRPALGQLSWELTRSRWPSLQLASSAPDVGLQRCRRTGLARRQTSWRAGQGRRRRAALPVCLACRRVVCCWCASCSPLLLGS